MVSLRGLIPKGNIITPILAGAATEYAMKTIAFNTNGNGERKFVFPKPQEDIIKNTGEWLGQPHIIGGLALAFGLPLIMKGRGKGQAATFRTAALGYLSGKYVSENFGVTMSPFRTSPKGQAQPSEQSVNPFRSLDRI